MKLILLSIIALGSFLVNGQNDFTKDQFLAEVLVKDYGILIVKNSAIIAENNNNIGNAGYLPTITVDATQNWSINNARQTFATGLVNDVNGAKNTSFNVGASLNWTFFDGFKMFATDKKLDILQDASQLNLRAQMEMKLYQASVSFYTLILLGDMQSIYQESIDYSKARYDQLKLKLDNGAASEVELVQSRLDLTADSAAYLNNIRAIESMKATMNSMISRDPETPINITGELPTMNSLRTWESMKEQALADNANLLYYKSMIAVSEQERKEVISRYYPQLSFYAAYNYSTSQSQVGILTDSRTVGPQFGLSLQWDILNRLSRIQDSKNSKITIENSQYAQEQQRLTIQSELRDAYLSYEWAAKNYQFEERNQLVSEEVASIMEQAYSSGSLTALELRAFQFSVIEGKNRLLNAKLGYITGLMNIELLTGSFGH